MFIQLSGSAALSNCTISNNSGGSANGVFGGGIFSALGTITLQDGDDISGYTPDNCAIVTGPVAC